MNGPRYIHGTLIHKLIYVFFSTPTPFQIQYLLAAVLLKDDHFYRVLPKRYFFGGAVQLASTASYCGLQGYMAIPDT